MSLTRINPNLLKRIITSKNYSTTVAPEEEYTTTAQYPEILDLSYEAKKRRKKRAEHDELREVKTVEEKQMKLNMPKYYGFKCYVLSEGRAPYDQLGLVRHATRTHLVVDDNLPKFFDGIDVENVINDVKGDVQDVILTEYSDYGQNQNITTNLIRNINRILLNHLSKRKEHLKHAQIDLNPRIESSWLVGGIDPPENVKRYRTGEERRKHTETDPTDRAMHYLGSPTLQVRSKVPLGPLVSQTEARTSNYDVPRFKHDPRVVGVGTAHRRLANVPGFWPGDKSRFGLLSWHDTNYISERDYGDPAESVETLHRHGVLAGFSWLNAQANYLGFTMFNDVTYPLLTQSILTNGKSFSFYLYQLNTLVMHSKNIAENPQKNVCWATRESKLFEDVRDGKLIGFNEDVLRTILKLYSNEPRERLGANMTPYLGQEEKVAADYKDAEKRRWLEREYKFLTSNRPQHKPEHEVFHWEKIYKVDHPQRYMEARRRPFELSRKPSDRTLDDRQAFYVPRALRPGQPRHKGRYAKEYFP